MQFCRLLFISALKVISLMDKTENNTGLSFLEKIILLALDDKGWFGNSEHSIKFGLAGAILFELFKVNRLEFREGVIVVKDSTPLMNEEKQGGHDLMMISVMDSCKMFRKNFKNFPNYSRFRKKINEVIRFADPEIEDVKIIAAIDNSIRRAIVASNVSIHA